MRNTEPIAEPAPLPGISAVVDTPDNLERTVQAPTVLAFEDEESAAPLAVGSAELTVAVPLAYVALDQLAARIDEFSERFGVPVTIVFYQSSDRVQLVNEILDDEAPDLVSGLAGADAVITQGAAEIQSFLASELVVPPSTDQQARLFERHDRLWLDPVVDGASITAAPIGAIVKGAVWYRPRLFEGLGYDVPETWAELVQLTSAMKQDGVQPWCFSIGQDSRTGESVSDWVEASLLAELGPDDYHRWLTHSIPANDLRAGMAADRVLQILGNPDNFGGGPDGRMSADQSILVRQLANGGCMMFRADSTIASDLSDSQKEQLAWFSAPDAVHSGNTGSGNSDSGTAEESEAPKAPMLVTAHYAALVNGSNGPREEARPAAEALLDYLSTDIGSAIPQDGVYPVTPTRQAASEDAATTAVALAGLRNPGRLGFDASEVLRPIVGEDLLAELTLQFVVRGGDAMRIFDRLETGWSQRLR